MDVLNSGCFLLVIYWYITETLISCIVDPMNNSMYAYVPSLSFMCIVYTCNLCTVFYMLPDENV